jgi:hypothetical protein
MGDPRRRAVLLGLDDDFITFISFVEAGPEQALNLPCFWFHGAEMEPPEVGSRGEVHQPSFQGSELRPEFVLVGELQ